MCLNIAFFPFYTIYLFIAWTFQMRMCSYLYLIFNFKNLLEKTCIGRNEAAHENMEFPKYTFSPSFSLLSLLLFLFLKQYKSKKSLSVLCTQHLLFPISEIGVREVEVGGEIWFIHSFSKHLLGFQIGPY